MKFPPTLIGRRRRDLPLLESLSNYVTRGHLRDAVWADVGAGDGAAGNWLASTLELPPPLQFDVAPRGSTVHPFDGKRLPLPDRLCSFVLLNWVLHHITADAQLHLLLECVRVAKGRLYIQEDTPVLAADWESCRRHAPEGTFRTAPNWIALFESMGLRVLEHVTLPLHADDDIPDHVTGRSLFVVSR